MAKASGAFTVRLAPQAVEEGDESGMGRMTIAKEFEGDLSAVSQGQMLAAQTGVKGSAGYVAMEKVSGSLQGLEGTFVLQHSGTMTRGAPELSVTVVPDSGTGELTGLTGRMSIAVADGKHSYAFEYTLPARS